MAMTNGQKAIDILERLNLTIRHAHVDMGGKHLYALSMRSHPIISEMLLFLSGEYQDAEKETQLPERVR